MFLLFGNNSIKSQNNPKDSAIIFVESQYPNRLNRIDSTTRIIDKQLNLLTEKTEAINKRVKTIDENTNDSYLTEAAKDYSFSLIYEILGYKSGSTNWWAKIVSVISLLFLLVRICYFFKKGKHPLILNISVTILASFAIFLPWSSHFFPNEDIGKSQIIRITKHAKELNDEIEKIQTVNFDELKNNIKELQDLQIDTIQFAKDKNIKAIDEKLNQIQIQLIAVSDKLDDCDKNIDIKKSNIASRGRQRTQTWFIILGFLGIIVIICQLMFLINRRRYY
jgi:ATP-dependent Zn protease